MVMVEVLTGNPRRRRWNAEQKKATVLEAEEPGMSISPVARKYELHPNQLSRVMEQLPSRFKDCNEQRPHKALKIKPPSQFRRQAAKLEPCPVN